jgi:hypothetical protein
MTRALIIGMSVLLIAPGRAATQGAGQGTIKGRVVWANGQLPERQKAKVDQDQKHCLQNGAILKETWVINKDNKGIRYVFVWLAPMDEDGTLPVPERLKAVPKEPLVIDQPCCAFVPHAAAMREGQVLIVKNSSPVTHNFRYSGWPTTNPGGNVSLKAKTELKITHLKADKIAIGVSCDIHKWMSAKIWVFKHPYFAVTDADGNFEIKNAPAGNWRLRVWHEEGWLGGAKGKAGQPITVRAGQVTERNLEWKAPTP